MFEKLAQKVRGRQARLEKFPQLPALPAGCFRAHLDPDALQWIEERPPTKVAREISLEKSANMSVRATARGDLRASPGYYQQDLSGVDRRSLFKYIVPPEGKSASGVNLPQKMENLAREYGIEWAEFEILQPLGTLKRAQEPRIVLAALYTCKWDCTPYGDTAWHIQAERVEIR